MKCDYCNSNLEVCKYTYLGKTFDNKRKRKTLKFCIMCQAFGVNNSRDKISEFFDDVDENSIVRADGTEMFAY